MIDSVVHLLRDLFSIFGILIFFIVVVVIVWINVFDDTKYIGRGD